MHRYLVVIFTLFFVILISWLYLTGSEESTPEKPTSEIGSNRSTVIPQTIILPTRLPTALPVETGIEAPPTVQAATIVPTVTATSVISGATPEQLYSAEDLQAALFLRETAAGFAFIKLGGEAEGRKVAVFYDVTTKETSSCLQGAAFRELMVEEVDEKQVVLSYKTAAPLIKPRIDLEVDTRSFEELTPEERAQRYTRYMELQGNQARVLGDRYLREQGLPTPLPPPSDQDQEAALQNYMTNYWSFYEKMRSGEYEGDPSEVPYNPDEKLEENVQRYFEENWPNGDYEILNATAEEGGSTPANP
jgi:hypothetical protein